MKINRPEYAGLALVALVVVAIVVLKLQHLDVPQILEWLAVTVAGGSLGIASSGSTTPPPVVDPAPAPVVRESVPLGPARHGA